MKDYQRYKDDLVVVARHVHAAVEAILGSRPQPDDLKDSLTLALFRDGIFESMVKARPHMNTALYPGYAEALARILLDDEWLAICN